MLEEIFEKLGGKSFDEYVSSLNGDELRDFLIFINSKVREIEPEEGGLFQDDGRYLEDGTYQEYRMTVGGDTLIAPRKEIQNRSFEKMAGMLKNVRNPQHKAIVMYTLINYLHLFQDGNGRTSRMVYDFLAGNIANGELDAQFYTHEKGEVTGQRAPWDKTRKAQSPEVVSSIASEFLMKYLLNEGLINSSNEDLSKHISIQTSHLNSSFYMSEQNKAQLSRKTLQHIKYAFKDNNENISTSALSMLTILTSKGNMQPLKNYYFNREWKIEGDLIRNRINVGASRDDDDLDVFGEYPEDASKRTFEDWTPEDYLRFVDIADKMKECIIDLIIDFAEKPESFKYDKNGRNVIDVLCGEKISRETSGVDIYYAPFEVDEQSRVYESIGQIREILDRPRTCDEEKNLIDTYEKGRIKSSDLSKARKIIEETLEQTKQNDINNQKDSEEIEWWV